MSTEPQALLRLLSVGFEGAGSYRKFTGALPLAGQGRVLICGEEGAGKSMIPEVMTLVLYGKGSPRVRTTGFVESSIVNETVGYRGVLEFESGFGTAAQQVKIEQAFKHKRMGSKYRIFVDGQSQDIHGKPAQKKFVKKLAPLSLGEWLGVVYLHQGGIHDLLAGSPKEKREYLTSVFGLDFYDDLIFVTNEELKGLKKEAIGALELEIRLKDLQEEATEQEDILGEVPGGIQEVEQGIAKLSKRLQSLSSKIGKLTAQSETAESYQELGTQIDEARAEMPEASDPKKAAAALKKVRRLENETRQRLAEDKTVLKSIEAQQRAYSKLKKAVASAKAELKEAKAEFASAKAEVKGLPKRADLALVQQRAVSAHGLLDADADFEDVEAEDHGGNWRELIKMAQAHRATAAKLKKVLAKGHSNCPTCNTELEEKALTAAIMREEDQANLQASAGAETCKAWLLAPVEGEWIAEEHTLHALDSAAGLGIEAWDTLASLKEALPGLQERLQEAEAELAEAEEPKSAEGLSESIQEDEERLSDLGEKADALQEILGLYQQMEGLAQAAKGIDLAAVEDELQQLRAKKATVQKKYEKAVAIKTRHDEARSSLATLNKQIEQTVKKLDEHAETALKIKHYELTLVPYFNSLRAAKVHSAASVLEGVLPVYVGAMAAGQYKGAEVKLQLADDLKKMDLLLRTGLHKPWLSAAQTSGGQRRRFTLATIAGLREVSPRKANIMFFDEPFADLQSEGKKLFVDRLLPMLMERCDDLESIFVIAHDQEVLQSANDAFDTVWVAENDELGSELFLDQKLALVEGK